METMTFSQDSWTRVRRKMKKKRRRRIVRVIVAAIKPVVSLR